MKKIIILLLLSIVFLSAAIYAQTKPTRFYRQHKSYFVKEHLKQTEESLLQALQNKKVDMRSSAAQAIRELEEAFPTEPFSSLIEPLSDVVQNENEDTDTRILAALALDDLHSDKGDNVIYKVAKNTNNQSVKDICTALAIESFKLAQ